MHIFRFFLLTLLVLTTGGLLGYAASPTPNVPAAPRIASFRASSYRITAGEEVQLSWRLEGGSANTVKLTSSSGVWRPSGNTITLSPQLSGNYTLVAQNRRGSDQRRIALEVVAQVTQIPTTQTPSGGASAGTASGGAAEMTPETTAETAEAKEETLPDGTFGISLEPTGPFLSDEASGIRDPADPRIVHVAPGGSFFAEVNYQDPDGIAEIDLLLVNSSPEGLAGTLNPERGPFRVIGEPQGNCDLESGLTSVRCRYRIGVAADARNITTLPGSGDEFAYVFRVQVADRGGENVRKPVRGYVIVRQP